MTIEQIKSSLCFYDQRNPEYNSENDALRKKPCFCDNCFSGRNELANELLSAINFIDEYDLTASWEKIKNK